MKTEVLIRDLAQYIEEIIKLKPNESELMLYPESLFFRGLSSADYDLSPSLARKPNEKWVTSWSIVESDLINSGKARYPEVFPQGDVPVGILAKMQHYGIYTRLMDITSNALVALYFACQPTKKKKEKSGQVIAFSGRCVNKYNVAASIIADTYNLTYDAITDYSIYYARIQEQPYSFSLRQQSESETQLESLLSKPLFVDPGFVSQRQMNQAGKFILFPNKMWKGKILDDLVKMEKNDSSIVGLIKIPNECKSTILEDLKRFGITDNFLFPDNIDKNCENIVKEQGERFR